MFESLKKMLEGDLPESEPLSKDIPIVDDVDFGKPSAERRHLDGVQKVWRFKNGFGASVVRHCGSYGGDQGLWELAVLKFDDEGNWNLNHNTEITNDVLGYLPEEEVLVTLLKIRVLEKEA